MECSDLPTQSASEPNEEASQPDCDNSSARIPIDDKTPPLDPMSGLEGLSQPPSKLSHRQRLQWLQRRRAPGLWARCDRCGRWRHLPHVLDSHELPSKWYCDLNPDKNFNSCSVDEAPLELCEEEDLIHSEYSAGSVVAVRMAGWPWWPAMVDDCPDTEQFYWLDGFSDIPTHYNVVFFDAVDVTRAWITPENMMPYNSMKRKDMLKDKKYKKRLEAAVKQADDAINLSVQNRLAKYSFIARYSGSINNPKKINKNDIVKFQKQLKRKYNIEFATESASDKESDEETAAYSKPQRKNSNVIILGTPKHMKTKKSLKGKGMKAQASSSREKEETNAEDNKVELQTDSNNSKEPDSMQVLLGTVSTEESFDNDTSKTYAPDNNNSTESVTNTSTQLNEINGIDRTCNNSPDSDNFEF